MKEHGNILGPGDLPTCLPNWKTATEHKIRWKTSWYPPRFVNVSRKKSIIWFRGCLGGHRHHLCPATCPRAGNLKCLVFKSIRDLSRGNRLSWSGSRAGTIV